VTVIDIAGATTGGAGRWRREALQWVAGGSRTNVTLVGLKEHVTPGWLVRRERVEWARRRIAANNVSYVTGAGPRVVLLRNPLHFLGPGELERIPGVPGNLRQQIVVVRAAIRRADWIVVPSSGMAERVAASGVRSDHLVVRHHPLTVGTRSSEMMDGDPVMLFPSMPAPHKDLVGALATLLEAVDRVPNSWQVIVTAPASALADLAHHPSVSAIGPQSHDGMDLLWSTVTAAYLPYEAESFGYPFAEARAYGVPILGSDTAQNREVAGAALVPVAVGDVGAISNALDAALHAIIHPDPLPFSPDAYFEWLVTL